MAKQKIQPPADDFNRGLAIYLEWGPAMATPVEQRLARAFPARSAEELNKLAREFARISSEANRIVIDQLESRQSEDTGRQRVKDIDPRVSDDNAAMMYSQARVSAWRDGYS